nr:DNA-directed RNA polymerase I subunit 2 isoform X2 [Nicotiana tomentosiformis]
MEDQNEGKNKAMSRPHLLQEKDYSALKELFSHHIESFDHMVDNGLETMLLNIKPVEVLDSFSKLKLRIWFGKPEIFPPQKERTSKTMHDALYPFECRQAKLSYTGKFLVDICFQYGDGAVIREKFNFGQFPIMLKSKLCHLRAADDSKKLTAHKEEPSEMGGYFILKGLERVIRLLILPKRNYPMSMVRNSFRDRREGYSDKAVVIRCVREDQSAVSVKLYYLNNGSARLGFWIQGREYLLPVGIILKALVDTTDHEIYVNLTCCYNEEYDRVKGAVGTQLVGERAKIILDEVQALSLFTRAQCLQHIGEHFQPVMTGMQNYSYNTVADAVLRDYIFVHLDNNHDKFNLLVFMLQKLFSLIDQTSVLDNPDSLQNQEVLLPGHLITIYLKEKLQDWLLRLQRMLQEETDGEKKKFELSSLADVKKTIEKNAPKQMSLAIENMLKTGRLVTQSGLDLQQRAGMTVQAERLNFLRFLSHFRAVHRGASFAGLRTTSVRKLLPESWGFLCPVHTPDGEPCGLLNHMTASCRITSYYDLKGNIKDFFKIRESILRVLTTIGMIPSAPKLVKGGPPEELSVLLDGRIVGSMRSDKIEEAVTYLRRLKVSAISIPVDLEVGYIPLSMSGAYPGLYLFTSPSRFVRPVRNISAPAEEGNDLELIGPFEQVYMEISCPDGGDGGRKNVFPATHREIHPTNILSVVGNLTPWSDHNQSPRNMYQCQMGKQTMGFSSQALNCRADQKLYHLQTPQTPIVRTKAYEKYCVDDYPLGTNAIVAVLAYSGYDMEDAMVLNKSSVDRGLCHGHIYQTETIDLTEQSAKSDRAQRVFRRSYLDKSSHQLIDSDGLPYVGQRINPHEPYCTIYNEITSQTTNMKLKGSEPVVVDYVAVDVKNKTHLQKVSSSRICSTLRRYMCAPIKGRKRGGGIRFGEMERDSLLAHGAAYLLHDRLHTSSDHHIADVCSECGSILTASLIQPPKQKMQEEMRKISGLPPAREPKKVTCLACRTSKGMETVAMPYVFKYLAAELAAMNIKMTLKLSNGAGA